MADPTIKRRQPRSTRDAAEAAFRAMKAPPPLPKGPAALPGVRESVTLRVDQSVLEHFQKDGAGWQERMVEALRKAAGVGAAQSIPVDKLNASNDE